MSRMGVVPPSIEVIDGEVGYPEKDADERRGACFRERWLLDPEHIHLNHAATGAMPRQVHENQVEWMRRMQRNPACFTVNRAKDELTDSLECLAEFVGCSREDLSFVMNATFGINLALHSMAFEPGDEILVTDHDYWVVLDSLKHHAKLSGATLRICHIPLPIVSTEDLVDSITKHFTPKTKLLVFSHVSSQTSLIFPVKQLCDRARERNITVCVDGAHALGMLPLEVDSYDCDYYAASCHKWLCGALGSGFLYVHPRAQASLKPMAVGKSIWRFKGKWQPTWQAMTWMGTLDPSPFLTVQAAIEFLRLAPLNEARGGMFRLARYARERLTALTGLPRIAPEDGDWFGAMASLRLPEGTNPNLRARLRESFGIHVPVFDREDGALIRISCPMYVRPSDLDRLCDALAASL